MRRTHPNDRTMLARMMECSELRISQIANTEDGYRRQVARRVIESAYNFRQWEGSHSQLVRGIVAERKTDHQVLAVKRMALSLIHRKAPFEYLRDKHVRGMARHRFFGVMYGQHDFASAVVREHRNFLSSVCSYLCVDQFCASITMDRISEYEKTYTNYWRVHTSCLLESRQSSEYEQHAALAQCIREDLQKARERILSTAPNRADTLTLEELRRPTGDTVKMKVLGVNVAVPGLGRSHEMTFPG
jgi:hypothetical protein